MVEQVKVDASSVRRFTDVVFVSTVEGFVHKYIVLRRAASTSAEAHSEACLIERIQVTPVQQPIASLTLDQHSVSTFPLITHLVIIGRNSRYCGQAN